VVTKAGMFNLAYDKAVYHGQKDNWDKAKDQFKALMVESPKNPDLLYDAGVASFKTKDFGPAAAYFKTVTEIDGVCDTLKEQAYFNLGNTNIERNNFQGAVKNYEDALKINPENKSAMHNLEIAKKLLQEQKQKKDKEKEQDKDKSGKQKEDQQKEKQDKSKKNGDQQGGDDESSQSRKDKQRDKSETPEDDLDKQKDSEQKQDQDVDRGVITNNIKIQNGISRS